MIARVIIGLGFVCVSGPLLAQEHGASKDGRDPNRVICRTEEVIGSRLGARRVCLTAAQWEDLRRETRQTTERIQIFNHKDPG